jgi:ABC-type glycerol-3-phosphate transport system substrate-binding protein
MHTSNFQIIVLGICTTLILVGIAVFASFGGLLGGKSVGKVVIWGTVDAQVMSNLLENLRAEDKSLSNVSYVQKARATYEETLVNAMANGTAPDLFMLEGEELTAFSDKISVIPYSAISQSAFLNTYIDEGQLFLTPQGSLAVPFTIDPLVMYWNRDLFAGAGVATAPTYWNDFLALGPKITALSSNAEVKKSAVALGEWRNIANAKYILSTLFMQAGDAITARGTDGKVAVKFGSTPPGYPANPAESALRFYTEFANPSKTSYSWNRSLLEAARVFVAGDLAAYLGFASEYENIADLNPNLRFSVAITPQIEGSGTRVTYGKITGLALPKTAHNPQGGLLVAQRLTTQNASAFLSKSIGLPSVRRDVRLDTADNASADVFYQSALISRSWIQPEPAKTDALFKSMIESVVSGQAQPGAAVSEASQQLQRLFR